MTMPLIAISLLLAVVGMGVAHADDEAHIMFVEIGESNMVGNLQMNMMKTAIYSPIQQQAVVTIYVQDETLTPVGVAILRTTLLAGTTPIEYGFTVPNECAYNSLVHGMICSVDFKKTYYVNVFTDTSFTQPILPEFVGEPV